MFKKGFMPIKTLSPLQILRNLCLVFPFAVLFAPQFALAQGNPDAPGLTKAPGLFISQNTPGAQKRNEAAMRHHSALMNIDHLKNKDILLNLFEDAEYPAERTHIKEGAEGEFTWSGQLVGSVHGTAHITVFGDGVAGSISTDSGRLFEINSAAGGNVIIEEIDLSQLPPHTYPIALDNAPFEEDSLDGSATGSNTPSTSGDSGTLIDLMIVYTQASRVRYGESGIQSRIINAVDTMNAANASSLVNARYRLVYMGEVNYVETGTMSDALYRLQNQTDGYMDNVHALRDQYNADIVSLIDEDSNGCGIAWVMGPTMLGSAMANYSFNVTYSGCLSNYTLAHEVGHNEGCAHNRESNGAGGGSYDYSFGYTVSNYRTIMATTCASGGYCTRIPYFSNPNVLYYGTPTGIDHNVDPTNSAESARTKNNNETIIANWRQSAAATAPQAPANLNLAAVSESQIEIAWTDNANNEEGFYLERSPNGVNTWTEIATLTANTISHSDNGLVENTTYYYRTRAYNGIGNSEYSNIDGTTTDSNSTSTTISTPAAPSNLTATVANSGRGKTKTITVTLNWKDNSGNETSFIIERCQETGKGKNKSCVFAPYVAVGANVNTYIDSQVSGVFKYRVKANNANGNSTYTNEVKI